MNMSLLPKSARLFSDENYWNNFFKERGKKAFEWYGEYPELCEILHKYIKITDNVLVPGCGNSELSASLYDVGIKNITSIDISPIVIKQMNQKYTIDHPDMKFIVMDVCNLSFEDQSYSCIIDKGTLDALFSDNDENTRKKINTMLTEFGRVLKLGGRYISVSLLQPHILQFILKWFWQYGWLVRIHRCIEAENRTRSNDQLVLPVFVVIATKLKLINQMKPILELNLDNHSPIRYESVDDVLTVIFDLQEYMKVAEAARKSTYHDESLSVDLYGGSGKIRYTLHIVDQLKRIARSYAVFIVPEGRETEWLFGTQKGRIKLCQLCSKDRLLVVCLHRNEVYKSLDSVKEELSCYAPDFSPPGISSSEKIPFLSLKENLGSRKVLHQGNSKLSGDYVVEDVTGENDLETRHLIFMDNQSVVQSEALLYRQDGMTKINHMHLSCSHHCYMLMSLGLMSPTLDRVDVALIGLGGGGLASFIKSKFKHCVLKVVEIDEEMLYVAKTWFGLVTDSSLKVIIGDGVEFISSSQPSTYHVIMIDADSKDNTIGLSCPPEQFLGTTWLSDAYKALHEKGVLVINVVCRDEVKRTEIVTNLKQVFPFIYSQNVEDEVNEIFYCCKEKFSFECLKTVPYSEDAMFNKTLFSKLKTNPKSRDTISQLKTIASNFNLKLL